MIRNKWWLIVSFYLMVTFFFLCCAHHHNLAAKSEASSITKFRQEMETIFADPSFANAHWGVAIQSLKTGEYFYLRNEDKEFMPASNMKLYTTANALHKLGPDFRFTTRVYTNGLIRPDGLLEGDLIVRGCGDPSLCGRFHQDRITQVFEAWADSLKQKGVKSISGRIIGDDNYFDDEPLGIGWSWDDLNDYYAAQISALTFNDNCVDILVSPADSLQQPGRCRLEPDTKYVEIINQVTTGHRTRLQFDRAPGTNRITCRGTVALSDDKRRDSITIDNPTKFCATVFAEVLQERGIPVSAGAFDIDELTDFSYAPFAIYELCSSTSPTLQEIITVVNKESMNLYAELLYRVNAKEAAGNGDLMNAEASAKEVFGGMGINPVHLSLADGSGLSRLNLITPKSTIKLLSFMRRQPYGPLFYDSLPVAGVDGTLKGRMRGTAAAGNIHAKTGLIAKVRALSGYATTTDGEELVFSMIVNFYSGPVGMANQIQDLVCERMANFKR